MNPTPPDPPNPFLREHLEYELPPDEAAVEIREERVPSLLQRNESPDLGFEWSVNPYRGCTHGCAFCYARTTHEYLGLGAGRDFETRLVAKVNAPEVLAREIARRSWAGRLIAFSGVTDCYQAAEGPYRLTRGCLEVLRRARNPVGILTRSPLIRRDLDVLQPLASEAGVRVGISLASLDADLMRAIEPRAAPPSARLAAVRALREAGLEVLVIVAPIVPGLTDHEVPAVLAAAREAGAVDARHAVLRLPGSVAEVFRQRLEEALPLRAEKVWAAVRDLRGGETHDARFFHRHRGEGARAEAIAALFAQQRTRLGFETLPPLPPRPPAREEQGELFG